MMCHFMTEIYVHINTNWSAKEKKNNNSGMGKKPMICHEFYCPRSKFAYASFIINQSTISYVSMEIIVQMQFYYINRISICWNENEWKWIVSSMKWIVFIGIPKLQQIFVRNQMKEKTKFSLNSLLGIRFATFDLPQIYMAFSWYQWNGCKENLLLASAIL